MTQEATKPGPVADLLPGFTPENDLERRLANDPDLLDGLAWGEPRAGHPEGSVAAHVNDLLERLENWDEPADRRTKLRFLALVHDAFKDDVIEKLPRIGRNH